MTLPYALLETIQTRPTVEAWAALVARAWETFAEPFGQGKAASGVGQRDRAVADLDLYLSTAGWDLWHSFSTDVPRATEAARSWWASRSPGRAVLILDALSLREAPWLLSGAAEHGLEVVAAKPLAAEIPADTTPFAKALGFSQRAALASNAAGASHGLPGARTETADIDWQSCAAMVGAEPDWCFWHHWPDKDVHDFADAGEGLRPLIEKVDHHLTSDGFWQFVNRLAEGRQLVITSDHGYAASELFPDASPEQSDYLKKRYKSGRASPDEQPAGGWVPPIDIHLHTAAGPYTFVNGRRKWKSAGGYPTLTHGGLSMLEVLVPFIELRKKGGV